MSGKTKRIYGADLKTLAVRISAEDREVLERLGNGNASEGLRRLIKLHNEEGKTDEQAKN